MAYVSNGLQALLPLANKPVLMSFVSIAAIYQMSTTL